MFCPNYSATFDILFVFQSTDDEAHILSQKYHNIGLLTKSVTFDRNCFVIELVKGCTLSWILHKFQRTFDSSIQVNIFAAVYDFYLNILVLRISNEDWFVHFITLICSFKWYLHTFT